MEPTVVEMNDTPTLSDSGSTFLRPKDVIRRCQHTPYCRLLTIGMLIAGGIFVIIILLRSKSHQSADVIPTNDPKISMNTNSEVNKPLQRTHRLDILGDVNLTYYDENGKINFDAFDQGVLDFVHVAKMIEKLLTASPHTQTIVLRRELMRIIHQLEYDVHNGTRKLKNFVAKLNFA